MRPDIMRPDTLQPNSLHPDTLHIADPDAIDVAMSFQYHGLRIQITTDQDHGVTVYSAWVDHATGSAVAVPAAYSKNEAVTRAKTWVRQNFAV